MAGNGPEKKSDSNDHLTESREGASLVAEFARRFLPELVVGVAVIVLGAVAVALLGLRDGAEESGVGGAVSSSTRFAVSPTTVPLELTSERSDGTLTVTVALLSQNVSDDPRGGAVFLLPAGSVRPGAVPAGLDVPFDWLAAHGAIAAGDQSMSLVLTSNETVIVRAIRPQVTKRSSVPSGALVKYSYGCGPSVTVRTATFDLDTTPPRVTYNPGEPDQEQPSLVLEVDESNHELVEVIAKARVNRVSWVLHIDYEVAGQLRTMTIGHNRKPFQIAGVVSGLPVYRYQSNSGAVRAASEDTQVYSYC